MRGSQKSLKYISEKIEVPYPKTGYSKCLTFSRNSLWNSPLSPIYCKIFFENANSIFLRKAKSFHPQNWRGSAASNGAQS